MNKLVKEVYLSMSVCFIYIFVIYIFYKSLMLIGLINYVNIVICWR